MAQKPRRAALLQHLLALAILTWAAWAPSAYALTSVEDFAADARLMRERRIPMLLLFSADGCSWCEHARQMVLDPMAADPGNANRVLIRQVNIDHRTRVADFSGKPTTHLDFAALHKARLTPTLMVLDADGREIAEAIVGVRLLDFYGTYVDRAIDAGLSRIRTRTP
jgi:thioredoxin-related protein